MILPCRHDSSEPKENCRICWLNKNRPDYAKLFRTKTIEQIKKQSQKPCAYLGELIEKKPACGCGARHKCDVHGECVISGNTNQWRICSRCPDYKAE